MSSPDRSGRPEILPAGARPPQRSAARAGDQISTERAGFLRTELARQPEVRPEVVARARALAADPNYPSTEINRKIAEQILGSPDLSEIDS
ncbi:MAG: hypothetical protein Q8N18_19140 [Opitutaceae bacterium]|nr:hypothetical protein [Opitutaceae bacterium]